MTKLTTYEVSVLKGIAYHEMNAGNGARPESPYDVQTWCWPEDFDYDRTGLTVNQTKGVLSSLVKKGLIKIFENRGEDATVDFTDAGFEAFCEVDPA